MAKKNDNSHLETPAYETLHTLEEVDEQIQKHKNRLVAKDIIEQRIKEQKKAEVAALNEQLKMVQEEREHELGVLSALEQHKMLLSNMSGGSVIPMTFPGRS